MAENFAIRRILVPLDWSALSEQAIPYAAALAGEDAEIVFLHVLPAPRPERSLLGRVQETAADVGAAEREDAARELNAVATRWSAVLPAAPRVEVATGEPGEEILRAVGGFGCDLIVNSSRGQGAFKRMLFGSVADRIAREATVPTLVVRQADGQSEPTAVEFGRVIVAYDGSALAKEALPVAAAVAARVGAAVHVVRATEPVPLSPGINPMQPAYPIAVSEELLDQIDQEVDASLKEAVAVLTGLGATATAEAAMGPAVSAIDRAAQHNDLIVLTSHGRSGVRRVLLGSVAEGLIRDGETPVLLVPSSTRVSVAGEDSGQS